MHFKYRSSSWKTSWVFTRGLLLLGVNFYSRRLAMHFKYRPFIFNEVMDESYSGTEINFLFAIGLQLLGVNFYSRRFTMHIEYGLLF